MSDNEPKKETVRITLPTRPTVGEGGAPAPVKKETVRINLPSRPTLGSASATSADAPKKESAKLSNLAKPPVLPPRPMAPPPPGARPPAGAVPTATAPLRPPPPASAPGATTATRPVGVPAAGGPPRPPGSPAAGVPPRPPGAPAAGGPPRPPGASITRPLAPPPRPGAPIAPKPPGAPGAPVSTSAPTTTPELTAVPLAKMPVADDAAATIVSPTPKKDTVRIEVPKQKAPAPQATVKMQTQPLMRPPAAEVRTITAAATVVPVAEAAAEDPLVWYASIGVLLFSIAVFAFQLLNFLALS